MVGIVIPTINRSEFLIRQLSYYANVGCGHTIYVGDSSSDPHAMRVKEAIQRLKNRVRIVYLDLHGANDYEAISELLKRVQDAYAAFIGDDDFLIPASLERCARFLDEHPDYESAHGRAVIFSLKSAGPHGQVLSFGEYRQLAAEHQIPSMRLGSFLREYWPVCFSVQRIATYRMVADLASKVSDKAFRELMTGCLTVIRGKAKKLDCLYLIRQVHQQQYFLPDVYDWITSSDWRPSYQMFRDCLVDELVRHDSVSVNEAREVVKQAFWSYLGQGLFRKWQARYAQNGRGLPSRWRELAKRVPGLRNAWHMIRSSLPRRDDEMSLERLLNPSSPYYGDFLPIYRAVTTSPGD